MSQVSVDAEGVSHVGAPDSVAVDGDVVTATRNLRKTGRPTAQC
jgi:hypothetical protein